MFQRMICTVYIRTYVYLKEKKSSEGNSLTSALLATWHFRSRWKFTVAFERLRNRLEHEIRCRYYNEHAPLLQSVIVGTSTPPSPCDGICRALKKYPAKLKRQRVGNLLSRKTLITRGHIRQLTSELTKKGNEWEANFTTAATRRCRIAAPLLNALLTAAPCWGSARMRYI